MSDLQAAADIAVKQCLGVKKKEKVLILTDEAHRGMSYAIFESAKKVTEHVAILEMTEREFHGQEPPSFIADIMLDFDVEFLITNKSLSHTAARRAATSKGIRIASLPEVTEDLFMRAMNVDYFKIAKFTEKLCKILDKGDLIEVKTELGTDIKVPIKGIKSLDDTGLYMERGGWGNLPAGEAFMRPDEGKSNGIIIFDAVFEVVGLLDQPIKAVIKDGYCVSLEGGKQADTIKEILCKFGNKKLGNKNPACVLGEFGIGTNPAAKLTGNILEDEKAFKTVHFAVGNNLLMGGTNDVELHMDGLISEPNVWVDGKQIMKKGEFLI